MADARHSPGGGGGVRYYDRTLRDGLSSHTHLPTGVKVELARRLVDAGVDYLEVSRFPVDEQPDDAVPLLEGVQPLRDRATIAVFAMGEPGVVEALEHRDLYDEIHTPCFVSEAYSRYAFGEDWEGGLERVRRSVGRAAEAGAPVTLGVGTAFGCPIARRPIMPLTLRRLPELALAGVDTVMLGDTAGQATPRVVETILERSREVLGGRTLRVHFHDTFGRALLNTWTAVGCGVDGVDASLLGTGGEPHPYFVMPEEVHNGNCPTEDLLFLLEDAGVRTGIAVDLVAEAARWLTPQLADPVGSRAAFAELVAMPAAMPVAAERP